MKKRAVKKIDEKDIKYKICNTALVAFITNDGHVILDIPAEDEAGILAKDPKKLADYQEKVQSTMEYLFLEGFCTASENSNEP